MKNVIIGSKNPIKVKSVSMALNSMFPEEEFSFDGCSSPSLVSDQPMSDEETYQGAYNRADSIKDTVPDADYWVGIEGGIAYHEGDMEAYAWVVVLSKTQKGKSRTASFILPKKIQTLVEGGIELGAADDMVFDRTNSKQQNGAVGILTNNVITRVTYYEQAVTLAFIPFLKGELYN